MRELKKAALRKALQQVAALQRAAALRGAQRMSKKKLLKIHFFFSRKHCSKWPRRSERQR
jgi:hypothetical protein